MPREVFDPKKPELEFYNNREEKTALHKREVSIFARRWFMFLYGTFLTIIVIAFLMYKKGFFNNIPYFDMMKTQKEVAVKINNVEFFDEAVITTIEVGNVNYTNSNNIRTLNACLSLFKRKKLIFNVEDTFYNIKFPLGQRIGFKMSFDKNYWIDADKLEIILSFDKDLTASNKIDIRKLKKQN